MSITIKRNTVTVPRSDKDKTLPWTPEMASLADRAERSDSLGEFRYTFTEYADAARFYERLLTFPHKR